MAQTKVTTNHGEIIRWVQKHKGKPQIAVDPQAGSDLPIIRIDFPGAGVDNFLGSDEITRNLSWEEFFRFFDEERLAFIYEDRDKLADPSLAYRFIKRGLVDAESGSQL